MPIDPNKVDKDLAEIEILINRLKLEWDKFFGGGSRIPPLQFQKQVEERFKVYRDTSELSYSQNFKLNTILGKFTSSKKTWDKMLRVKEEGIIQGQKQPGKPVEASKTATSSTASRATPVQQSAPSKSESRLAGEKEADSHPYQELFEKYVETRKQCGESVASMKYETFSETIEKQKKQIQEKVKGRDVEFYITVEDGKTKLKARPKPK